MRAAGLNKVALSGTRPVMQMGYIKDRYREKFGVEAISPTEQEQEDIDRIIFDELVKKISQTSPGSAILKSQSGCVVKKEPRV